MQEENSHKFVAVDLDINTHTFARNERGQSVVCTTVEGLTRYH